MPPKKKKKAPRNAYYCFMLDMKAEMQEKGIDLANGMADVAQYAKPRWESLPASEQEHYREMAKQAKGKETIDLEHKYDSTGRSFAEISREMEFRKSTEEQMNRDIEAQCRNATVRNSLDTEKFYFIQFNYLCKTDEGHYVPCEMSLLEYTLQEGIMKHYHCFIDPGPLPVGYKYDCMKHSEDTHKIPIENFELADDQFFGQIIRIKNFINQDEEQEEYHVYTMPEHVECAQKILSWLVQCSGVSVGDRDLFQVYSLSKLLFELRNNAPEVDSSRVITQQKLPSVALAETVLEKDVFMYTQDIACPWHEERDETRWCTLSIVKRYAFIISDYCCSCYNIPLKPKKHCPELSDLNPCQAETLDYKPKKPWDKYPPSTQPRQLGARSKLPQRKTPEEALPGLIQQGRSFFHPKQDKEYIMGANPGVMTEKPIYDAEELFQSSSDSDTDENPAEPLRQPKLQGAAAVVAMDEQKPRPALTDLDFPALGSTVTSKPVAWSLGRGEPLKPGITTPPKAWSFGRGFGRGKAVEKSPLENMNPDVNLLLAGVGRGRGLMCDQFRNLHLNS